MADESLPIVQAFVICDAIHADPATEKRTILGTHAGVYCPNFPHTPNLAIYLVLTELRTTTPIEIRLVDGDDQSGSLIDFTGNLDCDDPLVVLEFAIAIVPTFPGPGEYFFQLFAFGTILMERRYRLFGPTEDTDQ